MTKDPMTNFDVQKQRSAQFGLCSPESSLCSYLSGGSLKSVDVPCTDLPACNYANGLSGNRLKTDSDLIGEVLVLITRVRKTISSPFYREILRKCEDMLTETSVKMPIAPNDSMMACNEEFVIVTKDEISSSTAKEVATYSTSHEVELAQKGRTTPLFKKSRSFLQKAFHNHKEKQNYKKLGGRLSSSSSDFGGSTLPRLSQSCDESGRIYDRGIDVFSLSRDSLIPGPPCAILKVWKTCEHCNQLVDESLDVYPLETFLCIVCQKSFPKEEMECHLQTHGPFDDFAGFIGQ